MSNTIPIKTYQVGADCNNCGKRFSVKVCFGEIAAEAIDEAACDKCGVTKKQLEEYFQKRDPNKPTPFGQLGPSAGWMPPMGPR